MKRLIDDGRGCENGSNGSRGPFALTGQISFHDKSQGGARGELALALSPSAHFGAEMITQGGKDNRPSELAKASRSPCHLRERLRSP